MIDSKNSGSTCILCLVVGWVLYVANTGDSRAIQVLLSNEGNLISCNLNNEHKCDLEKEQSWIISCGGWIDYKQRSKSQSKYSCKGPLWVWFRYEESPGLAMTWSVGDHGARPIGVICDPEISEQTLSN